MSKYGNTKKNSFLKSLPTASIENRNDKLTEKCKFNFDYFDSSQSAGQAFRDWSYDRLYKLNDKLKEFSKYPLEHWKTVKIGGGSEKSKRKRQHVFEVYDKFPVNSDFVHPKHVPHEILWARFRLGNEARLIGFVLPKEFENKPHPGTGKMFDCNTFYVVFLDKDHRFYKTK